MRVLKVEAPVHVRVGSSYMKSISAVGSYAMEFNPMRKLEDCLQTSPSDKLAHIVLEDAMTPRVYKSG
jgi:hypothetical protein